MKAELAKVYAHADVEQKWYRVWSEAGYFQPFRPEAEPFSMVIPPPNVTGSLHMGHALNNTLQDILCRYKRMDGYNVLWVPGTDHAGIATQNVVERQLAQRGLTRAQLGRERFIEQVWAWRAEAGSAILHQLRALGVSCDWSRERFTMDEKLSRAVREAFVTLWNDGLLYRAQRLINWCPRCKTALADIEVVHEEVDGHLWHLRYPLWDDPQAGVVVATTRPETMLGDTAVAVHPQDERYQRLVGKEVRLPIVGRRIPIIADPFVDRAFGTGALKITPGHDFNDFDIGEKHGLKKISIFDDEARIAPEGFKGEGGESDWLRRYAAKDRFAARELVVQELAAAGLLEKVTPHRHALGRCYRCQTVVEPYLTPQWFVRVKPLAGPAIEAVRDGRIRIVPEGWANSYFAWMGDIKDWCVSRQIWWGHQIPAWYCRGCNAACLAGDAHGAFIPAKAKPVVRHEPPARCPECGGAEFVQDPDVLDTWFSSALWPFSTLGWPEKSADLATFYPTSVLVTGFDILFFWVARMIMMGLKFMGDVPFRTVYIHALVRDQEGQKMSKSKGNVIDPLAVMARYGTDAFRFTLAAMAALGRDIKLAEDRIAGYQSFINKLWNATRFVLMNSGNVERLGDDSLSSLRAEKLNLADRWILSRLARAVRATRGALDSYRFNDMAHELYQFTWHEYCDWYIEMSKLSLSGALGDSAAKTARVLRAVLREIVLLLHPIAPFVTEEIWQALRGEGAEIKDAPSAKASVMVQPYPEEDPGWIDEEAEAKIGFMSEVVRAIRNLRSEIGLPPAAEVKVVLSGSDEELGLLREQEPYLGALARLSAVEYGGEPPKSALTAVVGSTEIYLPLAGTVDLDGEAARLAREVDKIAAELERVRRKLSNREFLAKAKPQVVAKEQEKSQELEEKLTALHRSLEKIRELQAPV
ncbi:MAG TPA: valine--tRNA ligase [Candidatus Acidoferrales bacterium]|nr:valine--tRNA ligase [Candidatus Acidoferrales bacterium]